MKKNTLCIIPARSGSSGIKNKNIAKINNKPLIINAILFEKKLNFIRKIIVSTDSKYYKKICEKYNFQVDKLRPKKLSSKYVKTIDVIKYELSNLNNKEKAKIDNILILQPNCPFRKIGDFKKANICLKKGYDTVVTVRSVNDYPGHMLVFKEKNQVKQFINSKDPFIPRQKLPGIFIRAGSMYFFKITNINKYNGILGKKIYGIRVKDKYSVNIDNKVDMFLAKNFY